MMIALIIFKKELKSFLLSPITWSVAALFSLISGWVFFNLFFNYLDNTQNLPAELRQNLDYLNQVVLQMMGNINMLLLFVCPLVSMKIFSEEKKEQTLELYFASPIKENSLVFGKYFASVISTLLIISPSFLYGIIMRSVGLNDSGVFFSGYLAIIFNLFLYLAIGVFASTLSKNQVICALFSFILILGSWMLAMGSQITDNYFFGLWTKYFSVITHYEVLATGLLRTTDLVFYFTMIFMFLFLAKKSLETRNW